MGLDMYAYVAARAGQEREFWETAEAAEGTHEFSSRTVERPREIAYWRKHPSLHGWFRQEWESKGNEGDFNGDELEITWDMLERLEYDVINGELPPTRGFFFGDDSSEYYREQDLEFIKNARAELFMGLKVFYNSSW
jgi:hypothetical protein